MQNVDNLKVNDTNEVGQDHSSSSSPISTERGQSLTSIPTNFMADMSDSDEDDVSEVESFILDQGDLDEEPVLDTAKFLLQGEGADSPDLHNVDPETQARLEALLEATGIGKLSLTEGKQFADPEVLRRLTSSVSCALDEAAAALTRMRAEHGSAGAQGESGNNGRSLVEACSDGDVGTVRRLLDEGRNVNEITEEGESLLSLACSSGYYELAQLLLAMRANVEDRGLKDTTPLMEAASTGHGDVVKLLVAHGADVNAQTSQGNTPLMFACASGHEEVVQVLLQAGANVEDHNENGHTPLMEAASGGHVGVAKLLVEHGASINTHSNEFKESALTLACYKGHLEMVRFLLDAGADQEHKTDEMHTALMEASMDGHVEVARLLLDSGAQVNMPADSFESPLTLAACGGHVELALLLLERGANIEEVNDEGYTPLMEAAREGHEEMVALLLSQGADINAQTEETQETALTLACCGGFLDVADFLIKAGADIELGASTPLMEAAQEGHLELVRYLISASANVNAQTATGDTALTYACENGHTDVADMLLQAAAELEHESEGGRTPLMKAARAGHLCTVQFLISKGANVNKQTSNNDHNPLSLACAGGHLAVVELLLAHGADPTHKLKDNSTMLIEAAKGGHTAVVQLLLDYPNNLLASPPPPPDLSQLTTTTLEAAEAPRVPPHGLQVFSPPEAELNVSAGSPYLANVQPVTRLPQPVPIPDISHSQQTAIKQNIQKSLQRKTSFVKSSEAPSSSTNEAQGQQRSHHRSKSNAAAQANSTSIQAETGGICEAEIGGGGSESLEMKPSERLEACINSMMKKAELLNPSREEQILQKQQILEELQRVERELQEKAQAQLLLTAQHQQQHHHHHHLQGLATVATVTPTIATMTNNTATLPPMSAAHSQQLLLNSATILDMGSLPPAVVPELSGITGHLGLSLRATAAAHLSTPVGVSPLQPQQLYQTPKTLPQQASIPDQSKGRINKQPTKLTKNTISKQQQPLHVQMPQIGVGNKIQPPTHLEEVEKMNLRNVVLSEQQQQQFLQHPQQYVLSEITQNLTLRANSHLPEGTADALTLMQAAGGIKFTTDSTQAHAIPIIDPVAVSQAFALQQQQQQQQQLHLQQLPQPIQTEMKRQHAEKLSKSLKSKISKSQQSQQIALQHGQCQTQLIPGQPQVLAKPQLNPVGAMDSCTIVGNLPLDAAGVFTLGGMGTPTFPVSLAVSPATLTTPVTIATSCATFTHSISLEDGLMVAAPARTLHDTLGEIMTGPTTQLAGTPQMALAQQVATSHCVDPCLAAATSGVGVGVGLTMTSPSTALTPLTFHTLTPTVTSCVPAAVTNAVLPPHPHPQLNHVATTAQSTPAPQLYPPIDLNSQTDSNHDTALTLACAGGHEELVSLLLSRGADIEHRDKKGFTPLMLAATAGHAGVVEILLNHGADIEAQSERTKDTALSLACSGGRYEVVEILLARGANKEHRNVSDYTPLSLAASGGYVNIIKLLLSHGAEINSRTGSKLGISPLMLAAMNGHTAAVKLLLDMGSDINAQIETNRNTALTLACFQGRHEVVSLLLDRKANVEHRAKTGLTPLMEAASGGYVEVGRVLLDKGADVNAPPVPSSRDTALTIAADKGHYRFVELLLARTAAVDVKNKKGNSPLWLAANGGHLDVVQLLVNERADIDSQDNRKVSCLMAAFRKGHVKVVKWMVKHVQQFPSDQEMTRYIATISDKELLKKCHQCMEIIRAAKDRQAAEANKYATILLEELDLERSREESRRAAAARRRERKRRKKKEKQEQLRAAKAAAEENKKNEIKIQDQKKNAQQSSQSEADDDDEDDEEEEEDDDDKDLEDNILGATSNTYMGNDIESCRELESPEHNEGLKCKIQNNDNLLIQINPIKNRSIYLKPDSSRDDIHINSRINLEIKPERKRERDRSKNQERSKRSETLKNLKCRLMKEKELKLHEKPAHSLVETDSTLTSINNSLVNRNSKKRSQKQDLLTVASSTSSTFTTTTVSITNAKPCSTEISTVIATIVSSDAKCQTTNCNILREQHKHGKEVIVNGVIANNGMSDLDSFSTLGPSRCPKGGKLLVPDTKIPTLGTYGELALELNPEMIISAGLRSPTTIGLQHALKSPFANSTSPKKAQKREEGWKEVVRRSKKVSVPSNAISRVIGRGGCNIKAIREVSGAHIEVEKQKGQGDRTIIIRGSAEATRQAHQLITALIKEPERELSEILTRAGLCRVPGGLGSGSNEGLRATAGNGCSSTTVTSTVQVTCGVPTTTINQSKVPSRQTSITKISGIVSINPSKVSTIPPSLPANAAPPFALQSRAAVNSTNVRPTISVGTPFPSNSQNVWTGVVLTGKAPLPVAPRPSSLATNSVIALLSTANVSSSNINEKTLATRQLFPPEKKINNMQCGTSTTTKTTVSYTMAVIAQSRSTKSIPADTVTVTTKITLASDMKINTTNSSIQSEWSGNASSPVATNTVVSSGHGTISTPLPFSNNSPSATNRIANGIANTQIIQGGNGNAQVSNMNHKQPFVTTSTSLQNPPSSSPNTVSIEALQSTIAQEYSPFNNLFSKVAQPSVWGQKDKEPTKPNFASVAAAGVTSVSSHVQNSHPIQSSLSLSLSNNTERIVDAAKAPGYRGNLHISPNSCCNPTVTTVAHSISHSAGFGAIGTGPRSAPCTPPLGPIGPPPSLSSSIRRSTPPSVPSPPPLHSRSLPDSHGFPIADVQRSVPSAGQVSSALSTVPHSLSASQMPDNLFQHHPHHHHHAMQNMSGLSATVRLPSFPLATGNGGNGFTGPTGSHTNTTFSQHSPLSSVGPIVQDTGSNNGSVSTNNSNLPVIQSTLNPNAPDFSSRASVLMAHHGPSVHPIPHRLPSGPNAFQDGPVTPSLAPFRPVIPSAGNMNHAFPSIHGMPGHPPGIGRFPFHPSHNQQQQQATDFNNQANPGPVGSLHPGIGGPNLQQANEGMPLLGMMTGYPPHNAQGMSHVGPGNGNIPHHYSAMPSVIGIRPNQRSSSATPSVGTSSKGDEGSPMATISPTASPQNSNLSSPTGIGLNNDDVRKLPRPIGMERAQRKHPVYGGVSDISGIWSYSVPEMACAGGEWMTNLSSGMIPTSSLPQEDLIPPLLPNNYGNNRFGDNILVSESNHQMDHSFQLASAAAVASAGSGYPPFVNGVPPHMLTPHLYQSSSNGGPSSLRPSGLESNVEMWGGPNKIPLSSVSDGLSSAPEHKMAWHNWSQHQA